jgi:hypothetical protein
MILEFNARPGLNIQIANRAGLEPRLQAVLADGAQLATAAERVAYARSNFAADEPATPAPEPAEAAPAEKVA